MKSKGSVGWFFQYIRKKGIALKEKLKLGKTMPMDLKKVDE